MNDPVKILVKSEMLTLEGISQYFISFNTDQDKIEALKDLYTTLSMSQSIIYCNSVKRVIDLYTIMKLAEFPVCCIHSDMDKIDRATSYNDFKSGKYRVLISSNVTARGIDIQQLSLVINYDLPRQDNIQAYIHRIGRSGRFGKNGLGIDIQQVSIVINFDIPKCVDTYLHRIGRSGRWGRKGVGINFITKYDVDKIKNIEEHYNTQIKEFPSNYTTLF